MLDMEFRILYWLQELRSPVLDQAMEAITHLGDKGWFFILLGAALFSFPEPAEQEQQCFCPCFAG